MAQAAATNIRRRILGLKQDSPSNNSLISMSNQPNRTSLRIERRTIEKTYKQMDRIVKYCQISKMNLKNSPPYMLDILPDLYQMLCEIVNHYNDRFHLLNEIEYFFVFIYNLNELCTKTIECFKRAGHHMYDEQSTYRKYFIKLSLYFSHNIAELKSLFINGAYQGERFRLTKQEAAEFWKTNFHTKTIVPWEEFREKLNLVHPIQSYNESLALKNTIDLTYNDHVSIYEFDVFTRLFHPWSTLLTNWKLLTITHPGFMAFMTYDEVKEILTHYIDKPGSYVFRLSCTRLGQWAIGYVTTQNTILQTIPQTKSLIQSLIDGERDGYYKYPNGKNIRIDLSLVLRPTESNHINVSEEQFEIYSGIGTSFELCKICSVNNKDCRIQPCGHLLCQTCLTAWQNQHNTKPLSLCPFCRSEIKGFETIIVNPFDNTKRQNKDSNDTQDLSDNQSSAPPPIPPRPINISLNSDRLSTISKAETSKEYILSKLHNHESPSEQVSESDPVDRQNHTKSDIETVRHSNVHPIDQLRTIDDIRNYLLLETDFESERIEAALTLTEGLSIFKQYTMVKLFLNQVKCEQKRILNQKNNVFSF